jgi:hypothetical protein
VADAALRRAGAPALPRARGPRPLLRHDVPGAARRWLRVNALALRGWDDERIAREAGLTARNVQMLRRLGPGRFSGWRATR